MRTRLIAIIGDGHLPEEHPRLALAYALGAGVINAGHRLITGGRGGVMAAASEGAREAAGWRPGTIIGVLPGDSPDEANPWVEIALPTGLGHGRNAVVARADAVIAVGGGAGTLSEMAFAWLHDRLIIGLRCGGWSERLAGERLDERVRWPGIPDDCVWSAGDSAEALALLERWLKACGAGGAGR